MALFQTNEDLISAGKKEFNGLLNQQVFNEPLVSEEDMKTVVDDWVNLYTTYYKKHLVGAQQEQDRALQELREELNTLGSHFLAKYRAFLKSQEPSVLPSS
ncbi:alpha-hemoglobin-stabilizing protein [Nannospalax galili]|uniref:alpha-hemoglobin-stabilizing protein n=1 Tax=Nannospalax galili TaxID=1026970 RepID=UPI0004ED18CB|nr:alpha-hemoglobin-stabilizing protein [Nannospalax galili]